MNLSEHPGEGGPMITFALIVFLVFLVVYGPDIIVWWVYRRNGGKK